MTDTIPEDLAALPAELDLGAAEPLRAALARAIDTGTALGIDGAAVERISTACLQVLLATARAAERGGLGFRILNPSQVLSDAVRDLALQDHLPMGA